MQHQHVRKRLDGEILGDCRWCFHSPSVWECNRCGTCRSVTTDSTDNNITAYLHTYIPTYLPTYHTYIHTYLHTYIPTYLHTYIPTYLHTYIPTYLHTYLHTYLPTYLLIHTYIHTCMHGNNIHVQIYVYTYDFNYAFQGRVIPGISLATKILQFRLSCGPLGSVVYDWKGWP